VASGVGGDHGVPLGTLVAGSIIGLYYYLRVIMAMGGPGARNGYGPCASPERHGR